MKWYYDACGEYTMYKNHIVIKQEHPKLDKYAIYVEDYDELRFITTASSIEQFKAIINQSVKTL